MKRLHIHVAVADLAQSIDFYSKLFGAAPTPVSYTHLTLPTSDLV